MRYDLLNLANVPPPDAVETLSFDDAFNAWLNDLATQATSFGATYNVTTLRSDPLGWMCRVGAYRGDVILRGRVNDAVKAVLLPTSRKNDLDNLVTDFNLVRQTIVPADPVAGTAAVMESDEALLARRMLAPEALSCAGPGGAYAFFAFDAHPDVKDVGVYGPQDGFVDDGHVWIVLLSRVNNGVPSTQVQLAVAQRLHAWTAPGIPGYAQPTRAQLDADNLRPDTDWVHVLPAGVTNYAVEATIHVPKGADAAVLRDLSMARVQAYADRQHRIGGRVTLDGLIGAGRMMGADGTSPLSGFTLSQPVADVAVDPLKAPFMASIINFRIEVDDD